MDIKNLFSGVAIIIDDKINNEESGDKILQIRDKLKEEHIPLIEYEDIPEPEIVSNFKNISFVLLDWELFSRPEPGIPFDEELFIKYNIEFINNIRKSTFVPIFIFSRLAPENIIRKLSEEGLYNEDLNNYIFVKKKDELFSEDDENKIFTEIENWLKKTPSIYVLKKWEQALNKVKRDLFWSFYDVNHNWPSVLQKTFIDDGSDVNYELGNFIFKNIMARTERIKFDDSILRLEDDKITEKDIRKILEAERFIKKENLPPIPFTGDLYKKSPNGKTYLLNIRPECDIIRKDNPSLYCLEGRVIDENFINSTKEEDKKKKITFENNGFIEKSNKLYLPFIDEGKILEFTLNDIAIIKWNDLKEKRIGRILPPYITRIQQKYAFYLQRQGLPAIPDKAIFD